MKLGPEPAINWPLGHRYVVRRFHEFCKLRIRDRTAVDRERLYADAPTRTFLGIEVIRSHKKLAAFALDDLTRYYLGCHRFSTLAVVLPTNKPHLQMVVDCV
jgi:uncharacterized membrane protein